MGYNARSGHGYGNQKHGSSGSRFSWRKPKKKEVVYVKDDPEPKVPEETIVWTPRPLAQGVKVLLNKPTSFDSNGVKLLLSNDLDKQHIKSFNFLTQRSLLQGCSYHIII